MSPPPWADAAALVVAGIEETLFYYAFPREHWRSLRTNNPLERLLREVRRRTRAVGAFPAKVPVQAAANFQEMCGNILRIFLSSIFVLLASN